MVISTLPRPAASTAPSVIDEAYDIQREGPTNLRGPAPDAEQVTPLSPSTPSVAGTHPTLSRAAREALSGDYHGGRVRPIARQLDKIAPATLSAPEKLNAITTLLQGRPSFVGAREVRDLIAGLDAQQTSALVEQLGRRGLLDLDRTLRPAAVRNDVLNMLRERAPDLSTKALSYLARDPGTRDLELACERELRDRFAPTEPERGEPAPRRLEDYVPAPKPHVPAGEPPADRWLSPGLEAALRGNVTRDERHALAVTLRPDDVATLTPAEKIQVARTLMDGARTSTKSQALCTLLDGMSPAEKSALIETLGDRGELTDLYDKITPARVRAQVWAGLRAEAEDLTPLANAYLIQMSTRYGVLNPPPATTDSFIEGLMQHPDPEVARRGNEAYYIASLNNWM